MPFEAKLPEGVTLPPGSRIDTSDARYKALEELATRERWTQSAFSDVLSIEARRVSAEHERAKPAAPAPAPAASALPANWAAMSTQQKFQFAVANGPGRKAQS